MKRLVFPLLSAGLLASTGLGVGAHAQETPPASESDNPSLDASTTDPSPAPPASPASTDGHIECPVEPAAEQCPPTPEVTSVTSLAESISVAWGWPKGDDPADLPTQTLVRVQPGDQEIVVVDQTSTTIEGLEPLTQYTIELLAISDQYLSRPSPARLISTLEAPTIKPQARPGDVADLIVTLVDETDTEGDAQRASSELPLSGVAVEDVRDLGTTAARVSLTAGVSVADAEILMNDLQKDPRVASVEVEQRVYLQAFPTDPPDDTYWTSGSLWGLYGSYGIGIASDKTSMNDVWLTNQGSGAVVAVLDTGYTSHTDLNDNYVSGYDFVSDTTSSCRSGALSFDGDYIDTATYGALDWDAIPLDPGDWTTEASCYGPSSSSWHGTHVAGTIAAIGNNAQGLIGVAPRAKIQPIRVLSMDGGLSGDITAAIKWASGESISGVPNNATPADVINLSLGGSGSCTSTWQDAIDTAVANGSVVVVSAGNSTMDASGFVPANCNNVITVASSTSNGVLSSFSNYGSTVEITAPGSGILSTLNSGTQQPIAEDYATYSGTSMAAPHVSGVAALLKAADSTLTPAQVLSTIQTNALAFPTLGSFYDCTTSICGAGLLRAAATTTPSITSIDPAQGAIGGGESVTITGTNMSTVTAVTFGGDAGTVTAKSSTSVTVTTPAHTSGAVDVVVTNPAGSGTSSAGFRYFDAPVAASANVASGTTAGGTQVVITGTDFAPSDTQDSRWIDVTFGGTAASIQLISTTSVTVLTPAHAAGTVDIVVSTAGGDSTLTGAFTYVAPISYTPPSSGGSSGGSSSGSSSSASSGGGGGLNEISTIVPGNSGTPGTQIALAGWGLSTTQAVYFNDTSAAFTVISDSQVDVIVPAVPPGVYVIHAVLDPSVGRASYWAGYSVLEAPAAGQSPETGTAPATPGVTPPTAAPSADFAAFKGTSTKLNKAIRTKLKRLAAKTPSPSAEATIVAFTNAKGTKASTARAKKRADRLESYLVKAGFNGTVTTSIRPGDTKTQQRGALIYVDPNPSTATATPSNNVSSLIVRLKKGASITVDGEVRGSQNLPSGVSLTVGRNLGLRMYRVELGEPVTQREAQRIADAIARDPGTEFVEPETLVQAQVSRTS